MSMRVMERERRQGGVEMDKTSFPMVCPGNDVIAPDVECVDSVEGPKVVEVREEGIRGERAMWHIDEDLTSVLEEPALTHARQFPITPLHFLFLRKSIMVDFQGQTQCLMNETTGRYEHRPTSQRTRFECWKVAVEHVHDAVDKFLGQTHAFVVSRGEN